MDFEDGVFFFIWMLLIGLVVFVITMAATSETRAENAFKNECKQVSGEVRTNQENKKLVCYKNGDLIAKFGVNSPTAPLVKVG